MVCMRKLVRQHTTLFHLNVNTGELDHTTFEGTRRLPIMIVKFNISEYKQHLETWKQYWDWKTLKDKKVDLYKMIELELAERASEVRDVLEESHDVEYVVSHEDMAGLVKKLNNGNLT